VSICQCRAALTGILYLTWRDCYEHVQHDRPSARRGLCDEVDVQAVLRSHNASVINTAKSRKRASSLPVVVILGHSRVLTIASILDTIETVFTSMTAHTNAANTHYRVFLRLKLRICEGVC
jgi:hypothetical protein